MDDTQSPKRKIKLALTLLGKIASLSFREHAADLRKAYDYFSKALRQDPSDLEALCHLALLALNRSSDVEVAIKPLIDLFERNFEARRKSETVQSISSVPYLIYVTLLLKGGKDFAPQPAKALKILEEFVVQDEEAEARLEKATRCLLIGDMAAYSALLLTYGFDGIKADRVRAAQILQANNRYRVHFSPLGALFILRALARESILDLQALPEQFSDLPERLNNRFLQPLFALILQSLSAENQKSFTDQLDLNNKNISRISLSFAT